MYRKRSEDGDEPCVMIDFQPLNQMLNGAIMDLSVSSKNRQKDFHFSK
jgi:hypothetical protein